MRLWNLKLFFRTIHNSDMFFVCSYNDHHIEEGAGAVAWKLVKKNSDLHEILTTGCTIALRAAPARHLGAVQLWICVASLRSHVNCHWLDISCAICRTNNSEGNWRQTQNWPAPCNRSVNGSSPVHDCLFHLPLQLLQLFSWLWWSFEPQITTLH